MLGRWSGDVSGITGTESSGAGALRALSALQSPVYVPDVAGVPHYVNHGSATLGPQTKPAADNYPLLAFAQPLPIERLGDPSFATSYGARLPYMTGSMANGIASVELVLAGMRAGLVSSYGAAGQTLDEVRKALDDLEAELGPGKACINLIHSPAEPAIEQGLVELFLERGVQRVEASAYLALTPAVVQFRVVGAYQASDGTTASSNQIIAKASRAEVARQWLSPPPDRLVADLVRQGKVSRAQAQLAAALPMADDLTAEADSGGHTDNRSAITLVPLFIALRERLQRDAPYGVRTRVGAAGGISTPASVAAAFSMGAAYVVTGTLNQACLEAGTSPLVRQMLSTAEQADTAMAPAADMCEMGTKLQVLKRGTLFPMRANRLWNLYRANDSLLDIDGKTRAILEKDFFRASLDDVWHETEAFFRARNPGLVAKAKQEPKLQMALVFRWYLGRSSRWANEGDASRRADFQVWCGPAMGAFNEWAKGTPLESPHNRTVGTVAHALLEGAAVILRAQAIASAGVPVPAECMQPEPFTVTSAPPEPINP